jgi:hypothetical protein
MPRKASERNTAVDYINRDIVNIKMELQNLNKLVRDGNGQPSLMQQVTMISADLGHLEAEIKEAIHDLKQAVKNHHEFSVEKNKMSWQFKSAVWVALITSFSSVAIHLIKP